MLRPGYALKWMMMLAFIVSASAQNPLDMEDTATGVKPFDTTDWAILFPQFTVLPAPPSVQPGLRLTYLNSTGSIPGDGELMEDQQGNLIDPVTGKRYFLLPPSRELGGGGASFAAVDLAAIQDKIAVQDVHWMSYDPVARHVNLTRRTGTVVHAGINEWWIHPQALATMVRELGDDKRVMVRRMTYAMEDGNQYDAVRIQSLTGGGYTAYVFDEKTGFLLRSLVVSEKIVVNLRTPSGFIHSRRNMTVMTFKGARQKNLPWLNDAAPAWTGNIKSLSFQGTSTTALPGAPAVVDAIESGFKIHARGPGWLRYEFHAYDASATGVVSGGEIEQACGVGSVGGLFMPPATLAKLQPQQIIDQDPITGVQVQVGFCGNGPGATPIATISQSSNVSRTDYVYNRDSGMLIRAIHTTNLDPATTTRTVDLVRME